MTILLIENQKGGVAKTTTAVNLAHGAALRGYKTLIIDLDPQGNVADSLGLPKGNDLYNWLVNEERSFVHYVVSSGRERLDVIRSDNRTATLKEILAARPFRELVLKNALHDHDEHYDLVVIDCPPSLDSLHIAAMVAADLLLVPAKMDQFAIKGIIEVLTTLSTVIKSSSSNCQLAGILPTFYDAVTVETQKQLENLVEKHPNAVLPPIPVDNTCRVANRRGKTLYEMPGVPRARTGYAQVLDRVLRKI